MSPPIGLELALDAIRIFAKLICFFQGLKKRNIGYRSLSQKSPYAHHVWNCKHSLKFANVECALYKPNNRDTHLKSMRERQCFLRFQHIQILCHSDLLQSLLCKLKKIVRVTRAQGDVRHWEGSWDWKRSLESKDVIMLCSINFFFIVSVLLLFS